MRFLFTTFYSVLEFILNLYGELNYKYSSLRINHLTDFEMASSIEYFVNSVLFKPQCTIENARLALLYFNSCFWILSKNIHRILFPYCFHIIDCSLIVYFPLQGLFRF